RDLIVTGVQTCALPISKGVVTGDGWTVEIAIPFKSLRYVAGKDKLWGVHFWRRIKRFNNELDMWMPISRDNSSWLAQEGHISGRSEERRVGKGCRCRCW